MPELYIFIIPLKNLLSNLELHHLQRNNIYFTKIALIEFRVNYFIYTGRQQFTKDEVLTIVGFKLKSQRIFSPIYQEDIWLWCTICKRNQKIVFNLQLRSGITKKSMNKLLTSLTLRSRYMSFISTSQAGLL